MSCANIYLPMLKIPSAVDISGIRYFKWGYFLPAVYTFFWFGSLPHLPFVKGGCWRCSDGKGGRWGGRRVDPVQLHSANQRWACRRRLYLQIRARRWRRGPGRGWGRRGWGPGNASCQIVHPVQHMSLSTYCSTMQSPFTIKMTEQFISCSGMIDMSYLWKPCLSSTGVWAPSFFSCSRQGTWHFSTPFPPIVIWHADSIKGGDLSHAIMAENKGDEVCRTKESKRSKGPGWKVITIKGEASTHSVP